MTLPPHLFANPIWQALHTRHSHFALANGHAVRYPADVAPFAALAEPTPTALDDLASLLAPNDPVWLFNENLPATRTLRFLETLPCLRLVLPATVDPPPDPHSEILPLTDADAPAMVALTDLAFPGFFRPRTCEMGSYFGIRHHGDLIAMCGERIMLPGYAEISGLCTHPAHRGNGYAPNLIWEVVRKQRRAGDISWMHVGAANQRAVDLYLRMGFVVAHQVTIQRVALNR
jgi:predicted GNAT family acetyltransferase